MKLKKNIFTLVLVLLLCLGLIAGGCFWRQGQPAEEVTSKELSQDLLKIDLIDSLLESLVIPQVDFDVPADFGTFDLEMPDLSGADFVDIKAPGVDVNVFSGGMGLKGK